jgi:anti-sigma regulatory factor (Ser/Thr protein kinase)
VNDELMVLSTWALPGTARSAGYLRALVRELLGRDHPRLHDISLGLTEMFTNAVAHTRSGNDGWVTITMAGGGGVIRAEMIDEGASGARPRVQNDDGRQGDAWQDGGLREDGRGLILLAALSDRWGFADGGLGTRVWAEFSGSPPLPRM